MTAHIVPVRPAFYAMILALSALLAPVKAQDFSEDAVQKASPYKDLPGVEDSNNKQATADDPPQCSRQIVFRDQTSRDGRMFDDNGIVYRCEKNGIVVESTRPPILRNWNPLAEP